MADEDSGGNFLDIMARRQEEERVRGEQLITELAEVNQATEEFEVVRNDVDATMLRNLSKHAAASSAFNAQQAANLDELLELSNTLTDTVNTPLRKSFDPLIELFSPEDSIAGQSAKIRAKQTEIAVGENKQQLADNELKSRTRVLNQQVQNASNRVSGEAQDVEHVQNLLTATASLRTTEQDAAQDFVSLATDSQIIEAKRKGDVSAEMVDTELAARETRRINLGLQRISFAQQRYMNADDKAREEMVAKGQVSKNYARRVKNNQTASELEIESAEHRAEVRRLGNMSDADLMKAAENGEANPITAQQILQGRANERTATDRAQIAKQREGRAEALAKVERLDSDIIQGAVDDPAELKKLGVSRFEAETILADRETRRLNRNTAKMQQQLTQQAVVTNQLQAAPPEDLVNPNSEVGRLTTQRQREEEMNRRATQDLVMSRAVREAAAGDAALKEQTRLLGLNSMDLATARAGLADAATTGGVTTIGGYTYSHNELQKRVDDIAGSSVRAALNVSTIDNARISMTETMSNASRAIGLPTQDASLEAQARTIVDDPNATPAMKASAHQALVALGVAEQENVPASAKIQITQTAEEALRQAAAAQAELKLVNTPKQRRPAASQWLTHGRILDDDIAYDAIGSQIAGGSTSSRLHDAVLGQLRSKLTSGNTSADLLGTLTEGGIPTGQAMRQLLDDERTASEVLGVAVAFAHQNLWEQTARATNDAQLAAMLRSGDRAIYDANGALNAADMFTFLRQRGGSNELENFLTKAQELAPQSFRDITLAQGDSAESIASLNKILYSGSPVRWHMEVFDGKVRHDQARSIEEERRSIIEPAFADTVLGP